MQEQPTDTAQDESTAADTFGPIELSRRDLTKLAGITGLTVLAGEPVSGERPPKHTQTTAVMNVTPTFDRLLLQRLENDGSTQGGGNAPQNSQQETDRGIVRAAGADAEFASEGDAVLFLDEGGIDVVIGGEDHVIVDEDTVLAILED